MSIFNGVGSLKLIEMPFYEYREAHKYKALSVFNTLSSLSVCSVWSFAKAVMFCHCYYCEFSPFYFCVAQRLALFTLLCPLSAFSSH